MQTIPALVFTDSAGQFMESGMTNGTIILITVNVVGLFCALLAGYGLWWLSFFEHDLSFRSKALAQAVDRAVLLETDNYNATAGDSIIALFPGGGNASGYCDVPSEKAIKRVKFGTCWLASIESATRHCRFWWLGQRCMAIDTTDQIYAHPKIRKAFEKAIRQPCKYLFNPSNVSSIADPDLRKHTRRFLNRYLGHWREMKCGHRGEAKNHFDVYLVVRKNLPEERRPIVKVVLFEN